MSQQIQVFHSGLFRKDSNTSPTLTAVQHYRV